VVGAALTAPHERISQKSKIVFKALLNGRGGNIVTSLKKTCDLANTFTNQEVTMARNCRTSMVITFLILIFVSSPALAEERAVQLALFTPVQIFPETDTISGVRLNLLYGRNASVTGLDIGLINHTTQDISKGVQFGLAGWSDSDFMGWQYNSVNAVKGNFEGFQLGIVNYANFAKGLQVGLVNYVESMHGLQIGLVNVIRRDGAFPVFPIVNWSL
jgi:hypothetical protein